MTANPSIFEKAILGSDDYDDELREMAHDELSAQEIYDRIAIRDVQLAADVLRGVHEESTGVDGYVSLEVAPDLAHDSERTVEAARRYWKRARPPEHDDQDPRHAGGRAARSSRRCTRGSTSTSRCCSPSRPTRRWPRPICAALERRQADGLPLDVHSVASFFVSRVDTNIDRKLEALGRSDLAGRAALANARAAYRRFREIFSGPRWDALRHAGASVQRPLWASTGVKNPDYADTMYVDGLIGRDTVNTMPMATLHAAADHAHLSGPTAEADPSEDLEALREAGIDLGAVTDELLVDGINAVRGRDGPAAGRYRPPAGRGCDRPPAHDLGQPAARRSRRRWPGGSSRRCRSASPSGSGAATSRCGAARECPRSATASVG